MEKEYFYVNKNTRIVNTDMKGEDFLTAEGGINGEKVDALPMLFILMITGVGTGKTYGSTNYYLNKGKNIGWLGNTSVGSEKSINALLRTLQKNHPEGQFDNGRTMGMSMYDENGEMRVLGAGLRSKGSSKRAREFYADNVIYDEFNQQHEQAEMMAQNVNQSLDTIVNRWTDRNHRLDHIFMFGNKDGNTPVLAVQIMYSLGIYALNPFSEIFIVEREILGQWLSQSIVFNPKTDAEKQLNMLLEWISNPNYYRKELSQYGSGSASTAYFNDDSNSGLLDSVKFDWDKKFKKYIRDTGYLYQGPENGIEMNVIDHLHCPHATQYFLRTVKEIPKHRKYSLKQVGMENVKVLPDETKEIIKISIQNNTVVYDTVATKVQFLENNQF